MVPPENGDLEGVCTHLFHRTSPDNQRYRTFFRQLQELGQHTKLLAPHLIVLSSTVDLSAILCLQGLQATPTPKELCEKVAALQQVCQECHQCYQNDQCVVDIEQQAHKLLLSCKQQVCKCVAPRGISLSDSKQ